MLLWRHCQITQSNW